MKRCGMVLLCLVLVGMQVAFPIGSLAAINESSWHLTNLTVNGVPVTPIVENMTVIVDTSNVVIEGVATVGNQGYALDPGTSYIGQSLYHFTLSDPSTTTCYVSLNPGESRVINIELHLLFPSPATSNIYTLTIEYPAAPPAPKTGSSQPSQPVESAPKREYERAKVGNCKQWAVIREGAGDKYKEIGRAYLGEEIQLLEWNSAETWCKVFYNGGNNLGWLAARYIIPMK